MIFNSNIDNFWLPLESTLLILVPLQRFFFDTNCLPHVTQNFLELATSCNRLTICSDNTIGFPAKPLSVFQICFM